MEWLILLVIIPAIVVPVVLLLGFAGCDLVFQLNPRPPEPVFEPAFTATLTNDQDQTGQTIVQRIEPARLFKGGSQVQITLRSATNGNLVIDKMFISQPVDLGVGDPYDSKDDLTEVITEPVLVLQNAAKTLPAINYTLDHTKPLLIIFDVGSPGAVIFAPNVPGTEATAFIGPGGEAAIADRQPAYVVRPRIYLVERLDVA
jgi:hypothetical protein